MKRDGLYWVRRTVVMLSRQSAPGRVDGGHHRMNPRSADDTALLIRVAEGDPGAVREVLSRYSALVWSLASGLSKDPHEVEDVVQDIFVDVWRSAKRYDPKMASEATFIATIARRRVIDRRRRAGRRVDPEPRGRARARRERPRAAPGGAGR